MVGVPPNNNGSLPRCVVTGTKDMSSSAPMSSFWYALCPAGWACWSSRLFHAIRELVVPVIMANGALQPFDSILDWSRFSVQLDTSPLMAGDTSQLEQLHREAMAAAVECGHCTTCDSCTRLPLVQRMQYLERIRMWLQYRNANDVRHSAIGLFLVELHARQRMRMRQRR